MTGSWEGNIPSFEWSLIGQSIVCAGSACGVGYEPCPCQHAGGGRRGWNLTSSSCISPKHSPINALQLAEHILTIQESEVWGWVLEWVGSIVNR